MLLSCGIVGLPNVGKSTLFNALLSRQIADTSPYPFCTIEPNVGIVEIPDTRINQIAEAENSKITAPAIIKFVDIAGLVKNAHQGEGLGNQFLAHIREVETIIHVIRLFKNDLVTTLGDAEPTEDYKTIQTELILADLGTLDKQKEPKGELTKELKLWWQTIIAAKEILDKGIALDNSELTAEQKKLLKPLCLLTIKPELKVLNIDESQYDNLENIHKDLSHLDAVAVCAKLESELIDLDQSERGEYLLELGIKKSGLEELIIKAFKTLDLITFYTANDNETHSWTINKGTVARAAAGEVHSDMEKGFIKAAVCPAETFTQHKGWKDIYNLGLTKFEGSEYQVQDGDVLEFKFKV